MARTPHPLFARVAERHRWSGPLAELLPVLRRRAANVAAEAKSDQEERVRRDQDRDWAWVVLQGGAVIGLRVRGDLWMRKELRIARKETPKNVRALQAWEREVGTFLRHFGITPLDGETPAPEKGGWWRQPPHPNDVSKGGVAVRFLALLHGEIRPGWALCNDCLHETGEMHEVEWTPLAAVRGQRCSEHAVAAGRHYTQRVLRLVP